MESRPVDPGSIQGSHRPISFIRIKHRTRADDILCKTEYSLNNHIVGLVHKKHIIRTRLMYHAACKDEFQPFKRLYSQLTFFNIFLNVVTTGTTNNSTHPTPSPQSTKMARGSPSQRAKTSSNPPLKSYCNHRRNYLYNIRASKVTN